MLHKVLVVDDEPINRTLIEDALDIEAGFECVSASDGVEAWEILSKEYQDIQVIVLDRMMPNMNGMELLQKVNEHPDMSRIPVILQTAAGEKSQIAEGIAAGAYYYLVKPYDDEVLVSIVSAARDSYGEQSSLRTEVRKNKSMMGLTTSSSWEFKSILEAKDMAIYIANYFPEAERVVMGLSELFINAVEHGNLGISYDEKTELNKQGIWQDEIEKRLLLPEYKEKLVRVQYDRVGDEISLRIKDEGKGFDWKRYMEIDPSRATDNHGRGIALTNMMSFDELEYIDPGNEVICKVASPSS